MIAGTDRKVWILWLVGLVTLSAVGLGLALAELGPEAVAVLPALVAGVAVLLEPVVGLVGLAWLMPFEDSIFLGGVTTLTKLLGVAVAGAWVLSRLVRREPWKPLLNNAFFVLGVAFIALAAASALWAEHVGGIRGNVLRLGMMFVLGLLAVDLLRDWRRVEWLLRAFVVGGLVAIALTLPQYFGIGVRRAGEGIAGGVNATAMALVVCFPFAVFLFRASGQLRWRFVGLAYVALAPVAIAATLSRMAFLLLPLVAAVEWWGILRGSDRKVLLAVATAVALLVGGLFVPWDAVEERADTIGPYVAQTLGINDRGSVGGSGRGYHLKVALAIFADHPFVGAGYDNYGRLFLERYQFDVEGTPEDKLIFGSPRSPHSAYFGVLADLGLAGIVLWLALVGTALWGAGGAYRRFSSPDSEVRRLMARAVLISLCLFTLYGFYADLHKEKIFWLLLGIAVAIGRLSREREGELSPEGRAPGV